MAGFSVPSGFLRKHRATVASWTVLAVIAGSLIAYAVNSDGFKRHEADLNDGGVWVTNGDIGAVGRQNVPIGQLDAFAYDDKALDPADGLDVLQNESAVISYNPGSRSLVPVDVAQGAVLPDQRVSIGGDAALGGDVVSVVDHDKGSLWATVVDPATGRASLTSLAADAKPLTNVGPQARVAVGPDGTIVAASAEKGSVTTLPAAPGGVGTPRSADLDSQPQGEFDIAAVGDRAVVLDEGGSLITADRTVKVGENAAVQQSGAAGSEVLVATDGKLLAVSFSDGSEREVADAPVAGDPGKPVNLNGCAWAVWAAGDTAHVVTACGDAKPTAAVVENVAADADLRFRVNRNQILLNDAANGPVWRIEGDKVVEMTDWNAYKETNTEKEDDPDPTDKAQDTPPVAKEDKLGVRTGRTTVLHVLDNDRASREAVLAVVKLNETRALPDGVRIDIAPDRQSLLASVTSAAPPGPYTFGYTIDDGSRSKKSTAEGKVRLTVHGAEDDGAARPTERENLKRITQVVTSGGTLEIPVAQDWRDKKYGVPIAIADPKADQGTVSVTSQNLLKFVAPEVSARKTIAIRYDASAGGEAAGGTARVTVLPDGSRPEPAQPQPDAAAGEVGGAITIRPLDNDIPGADPFAPQSRLKLAGKLSPVQGQPVDTDLETGVVTVRPTRPGSYEFTYAAGFGNARAATETIRVVVTPPTGDGANPVAAPDSVTVRGMSPAVVDVLANDFDPKGGLLAVTGATPTGTDSKLQVAIIDGRWLRVSATDPQMRPASQAIEYTVSNGSGRARGSLTVTQEEALPSTQNKPVTELDEVTVRAGASVAIPVLENDSTPSGDPVGLVPADSEAGTVGTYQVLGQAEDRGTAYLDGRRVRYVAPKKVDGPLDLQIQYIAVNTGDPSADSEYGTIKVHVTPPPGPKNPNQVPTPRAIEARVVQGDVITLRLPPVGLDPDGDPVSIVSVGDAEDGAARLGRVLGFTGGTIDYQAFPGQTGTDVFSYLIDDGQGGQATGRIRVAVVEPGPPQPPVALDDLVTADAGRKLVVDVIANDLRTPGTELTVEPLDEKSEGKLDDKGLGLISVTAKKAKNALVEIAYRATNGIDTSAASLRVRTIPGFNNPPVAQDVIATPDAPDAKTVEVNVLAQVYDIDGPRSALKLSPIVGATDLGDGKVRVPVTEKPQSLPFTVTDGDGAVASAVVLVPAPPKDFPYLATDDVIEVEPGQTVERSLADLVVDPEGDKVYFTTLGEESLFGAPQGALSKATAKGDKLVLTAGKNAGPATVTFTVSDRARLGDKNEHVSTLTVPVRIGADRPVLTCPDEPLRVAEGGRDLRVDVASVCHVWTSDPEQAGSLEFEGSWADKPRGIDLQNEGRRVLLRTGTDAKRGDGGKIAIGVKGQKPTATLNVLVTELPPPTLATITRDGKAGTPITVDVAQYLKTQVAPDALDVHVLGANRLDGRGEITTKGSTVTVTPGKDFDGLLRFKLEVGDLGPEPGTRPAALGELRIIVAARPDAPQNLVAGDDMLSNTVVVRWNTPDNNGSGPLKYVVDYRGSKKNGTFPCAGSPCRITGLPNGAKYTFKVKAVNAVGESDWSNSDSAQPDKAPGAVLNLRVVKQSNLKVTLAWDQPAACDCSTVKEYKIVYAGKVETTTATRAEASVSANGPQTFDFTVIASNDKGDGEGREVSGMGATRPETPKKPTFTLEERPAAGQKGVTVAWDPVAQNGPDDLEYQVTRTGGGQGAKVSAWQTETTWKDDLGTDGQVYSYTVIARNGEEISDREGAGSGDYTSPASPAGQVESASTPDAVEITEYVATGSDGQVRVAFRTGLSRGKDRVVECRVNNNPCGSWTFTADNQTDSRVVNTGVPNGSTATIDLRLCNGSQGGQGTGRSCSAATTRATTPYGAIPQPAISASASGENINVNASWGSNGKNVNVVIRRNGVQIYAQNNVAGGNHSFSDYVGYSQTRTYEIVVTDTGNAPGQTTPRQARSASASATTPTPPPTVTISKGGSAVGQPGCSNASCRYIVATTANFGGNVTCRVEAAYGGTAGFITWTQSANQTKQSPNYYGYPAPNGWVEISCGGVRSPRFYW